MEGVELEFREDALKTIAEKAMERKTGARGLRSILENILLRFMYELPSLEGLQKVVIDKSIITEGKEPLLIYEKQKKLKKPTRK